MRVQALRWLTRGATAALVASAASCGGDSTATVRVTGVRFAAAPTTLIAGATFSVTVELIGSNSEVVTNASEEITISLLGAAGVTLNGPATMPATDGVATFSGLSINQAAPSVQFHAAAGDVAGLSNFFGIVAGAAAESQSSVSPNSGTLQLYQPTPFVFTFKDTYGNPVVSAAVTLSASLPSVAFSSASGTTTAAGTFTTNVTASGEGTSTFTGTVAGVPIEFDAPLEFFDFCVPTPAVVPGDASGSLPAGSGCIIGTIPATTLGFTIASYTGVSLALTSQFSPIFEINTLPPVAVVGLTPGAGAPPEWLLPPGDYQIRIGAQSGTGQFTLTSALVAGNTGCVERYLVRGATLTDQTLASGDCALQSDGTFLDPFTLLSTAPCTITMRAAGMDAYLFLIDAVSGNLVAEDDNSGGGTDARIQRASCTSPSGPVAILANNWGGAGAYTLEIAVGAVAGVGALNSVVPVEVFPAAADVRGRLNLGGLVKGSKAPASAR